MKKLVLAILAISTASMVFAAAAGESVFYSKCTGCHGSALALNKKKSQDQWMSTINRMQKHGLKISSDESKAVAEFLAGSK